MSWTSSPSTAQRDRFLSMYDTLYLSSTEVLYFMPASLARLTLSRTLGQRERMYGGGNSSTVERIIKLPKSVPSPQPEFKMGNTSEIWMLERCPTFKSKRNLWRSITSNRESTATETSAGPIMMAQLVGSGAGQGRGSPTGGRGW